MPAGKRTVEGSTANYWELDAATLENAQVTLHQKDHAVPLPTEPHWWVVGTVTEVIHEADGDTHMWVTLDATSKVRIACEFTPQQKFADYPLVGERVRMYGILRWDGQHNWWELHPVDFWERI